MTRQKQNVKNHHINVFLWFENNTYVVTMVANTTTGCCMNTAHPKTGPRPKVMDGLKKNEVLCIVIM